MPREITSAAETASQEPIVRPVMFVELLYDSGPVRAHTWIGDLLFDSDGDLSDETFIGVGSLGGISAVGETAELTAIGATVSLSGIPQEFIALAFEKAQGRRGTIWLGFLDENYILIDAPAIIYRGFIDNTNIVWGSTGTVSVNLENRMLEWNIPDNSRYTDAVLQHEFPGDKFFEFLPQTVEKEILWGVPTDKIPKKAGDIVNLPPPGEFRDGLPILPGHIVIPPQVAPANPTAGLLPSAPTPKSQTSPLAGILPPGHPLLKK